jgi:uncharacterized membrane protein
MMPWKPLAAALALGAVSLTSTNAFAWFDVCNKTPDKNMYIAYVYYEPSVTTVYTDVCGSYEEVYSPSYFTSWKVSGWWYLTPGQCATTYGGPVTNNTRSYVYADITDGSTLVGANVPITVVNPAFSMDEYYNAVIQGDPVETTGDAFCANPPATWTAYAAEVWQAGYTNFTYTID